MKVTSDGIVAAGVLGTGALLAHNYAPGIVGKTIDTTLGAASGIFAGVKVGVESVLNTPVGEAFKGTFAPIAFPILGGIYGYKKSLGDAFQIENRVLRGALNLTGIGAGIATGVVAAANAPITLTLGSLYGGYKIGKWGLSKVGLVKPKAA
ncbi:hypothetical protein BKN14_01510 [Candidatus Gracilibacteria bacterium HOT-871]|nr:hypothetical protein BKN14_01510 [Candidatus Gracilibacteria bacterium HOT-871]MBB1565236.1 hypothetical protein [Candidatus Gracilibacteria bacterium]